MLQCTGPGGAARHGGSRPAAAHPARTLRSFPSRVPPSLPPASPYLSLPSRSLASAGKLPGSCRKTRSLLKRRAEPAAAACSAVGTAPSQPPSCKQATTAGGGRREPPSPPPLPSPGSPSRPHPHPPHPATEAVGGCGEQSAAAAGARYLRGGRELSLAERCCGGEWLRGPPRCLAPPACAPRPRSASAARTAAPPVPSPSSPRLRGSAGRGGGAAAGLGCPRPRGKGRVGGGDAAPRRPASGSGGLHNAGWWWESCRSPPFPSWAQKIASRVARRWHPCSNTQSASRLLRLVSAGDGCARCTWSEANPQTTALRFGGGSLHSPQPPSTTEARPSPHHLPTWRGSLRRCPASGSGLLWMCCLEINYADS